MAVYETAANIVPKFLMRFSLRAEASRVGLIGQVARRGNRFVLVARKESEQKPFDTFTNNRVFCHFFTCRPTD